jgi:putative inorganic carbon (hco3(-)) transporter
MAGKTPIVEDFYIFKVGAMWRYFKKEPFSFWMICGYMIFEFVRPQAIYPALQIIPWAQLLLLGSLVFAVLDKTVKWTVTPANKWMILFLLAILVSSAFAIYPEVSWRHTMDFLGWFIIYFLIVNIVNTRERFYIVLLIFIVAAGKIAVGTTKSWAFRGFTFTDWGLSGPQGFFQNSGELSVLTIMLFPLAYFTAMALKDKGKKWEFMILLFFAICSVMTTLGASSRGSQLALAIQVVIIFRKNIFRFKTIIPTVILLVGLYSLLPDEQKDRFTQAGEDRTSQQRLLYWEHGWDMMLDHPFLGVGFYNFIPYYEAHYPYDMLYGAAQLPHNIFVQVGTDTGFTGLFFFLNIILVFFLSARTVLKSENISSVDKAIACGLVYGFFAFIIAGQFVTITYYPFMWIHLALMMALYAITRKNPG